MTDQWKPSVRIWSFADAPEEFRRLSPFEADMPEELGVHAPPELCTFFAEANWLNVMPPALWFLWGEPGRHGPFQHARDDFGSFSLHDLPDGARVAITAES